MSACLRPMREDEFPSFLAHAKASYARDMIENGGLDDALAHRKSEADHASLYADGLATSGITVLVVEVDGRPVGHAVLGERTEHGVRSAFLWDLGIQEAERGRGHGRVALELVEAEVRARGYGRIALNVFGGNEVARRLYRSAGYGETAVTMAKDLG